MTPRSFHRASPLAAGNCRRCAQRGAALILALLTVALVAGLAAAAMGELGLAVDSASGRHDQIQARLLARGAVDWARNVLAEDARRSNVDHLGEDWAIRVPPTPVEDGEVGGEVQDLSGRINLNDLVAEGRDNAEAIARMARLLRIVGVSEAETGPLLAALLDWLDADHVPRLPGGAESAWYGAQLQPRRAANGPLGSLEELGQVRGFSPALLVRLGPYIAALPANSRINVNTAPAEVLAASIPGLTLDAAHVLIAERDRAWFKDVSDFNARLPGNLKTLDADPDVAPPPIATTSRHFLVTGRARYGVAMVRMDVLLDRRQKWADIVWQKLL